MKTKLYLDTSIPSAYYDNTKPVRQLITQKWFENDAKDFELYASIITINEIKEYLNIEKRDKILKLIDEHSIQILEFTEEAKNLAKLYIDFGAIPKSEPEDAYHIAIATIHKIETLASWNFKHIVSINPIRKIHEINRKNDYEIIEIGTLELYGGSKYGNV